MAAGVRVKSSFFPRRRPSHEERFTRLLSFFFLPPPPPYSSFLLLASEEEDAGGRSGRLRGILGAPTLSRAGTLPRPRRASPQTKNISRGSQRRDTKPK